MHIDKRSRELKEHANLAPFAVASLRSRGRVHPEAEHPWRMAFERDRDRILHSRCFRRLEYKAQVFVNGTADHYRTRLTHTIEMAAVCRTLARRFGVNEDLTESIALAHDIGHSPFGHCGEFALAELMKEHGGFDHNRQSLRWVERLEPQYPGFPGLNLTWEVRAGLLKHEAASPGAALDGFPIGPFQFLEAQIADIADDMTYYAHDVDDAIEAGVLDLNRLRAQRLWQRAEAQTHAQYIALPDDALARITVRNLLDVMVGHVAETGENRLAQWAPDSFESIMNAPCRALTFHGGMAEAVAEFHDFLYREFYWSEAVQRRNRQAVGMLRSLFHHYVKRPENMGKKAQARIAGQGLYRTVCDYLSGFTDMYVFEEFRRLNLTACAE